MTKRIAVLLSMMMMLAAGIALAQSAGDDEAAIKEVVDRAYVQGVHIDADPAKIRSGMHDSFIMFVRNGDQITGLTRDAWIARIEESNAKPKPAKKPETKADIDVLDRAGDTAVVRVKLYRDGKQIFTDYISLYRFASGWKLVGKVFQRH
jgi:type II secretory pathway component PulC